MQSTRSHSDRQSMFAVTLLYLLCASAVGVTNAAATVSVSLASMLGTGSSLAAPLYTEALFAFEASGDWNAYVAGANLSRNNDSSRPSTQIHAEYSSSGSTAGKTGLIAGMVDFAGSDSGFSNAQYAATPDLQQIPSLAAAVVIIYNLPELNAVGATLRLDRTVLPLIFAGNLTQWNDPRIAALQATPAISALLPAQPISVVVRADGSGTTNILTQGLSAWSEAWRAQVGISDKPTWPAALAPKQAALATGVAATVLANDYSLSYSPLSDAQMLGLDYAELRNAYGSWVLPTPTTVGTVLLEKGGALDARWNTQLVDGASVQSYPLVGYSYICFRHTFTRSNCASRALLARFLRWYYTSSATKLIARDHGLEMLPTTLAETVVQLIASTLLCNGETLSGIVPEPARVLQVHATFMGKELASLLSSSRLAVASDFTSALVPVSRSATIRAVQSGAAAVGVIASSSRPGDDAFSDDGLDLAASPSLAAFPISVTAVAPIYSVTLTPAVPAVDSTDAATLNLTLSVLASIVLGDVTQWNDPAIASLNPLIASRLPSANITLVMFDGESEVTSLWRAVLSEHSAVFPSRVGVGSSLTGLPLSALPSVVRVSSVELRVEAAVLVHPNSLAFTQWAPSLESRVAALLTEESASTQEPLQIDRSAIAACVRVEGTGSDAAAARSLLLSPPALASNPDNSLAPSETSYSFSAMTFPSVFHLDLRPSVAQGNQHTCWPFASALYAIAPVTFTNATDEEDWEATQTMLESASGAALTESSQLEALRMLSFSGSGAAGKSIIAWLYWASQGGYLLSRPASSLLQISVPGPVRLATRSALEHASIDSKPILLTYVVSFEFASALQITSFMLCGIGAALMFALAAFVVGWRHSPIVRASSAPFLLYIITGGMLQYASLPWLTVSEPSASDCAATVWLFTAGFAVTFGSLLLKNLRIYAIYRQRRLTVIRWTNKRLSLWLAAIVAAFIAVLTVWQLAAPLAASVSRDYSVVPPLLHTQCAGESGFAFVAALVAMMLVLVLVTTCVSILVRNAPSEFAETKTVAFSIYICLVLYVVVLLGAIMLLGGKQRQAATILIVGGIFVNATATAVLMLGTKAWAVYCGGSMRMQLTATQGAPLTKGGVKLHLGTTNPRSGLVQRPRSNAVAPAGSSGAQNRYTVTPGPLSSLGVDGQAVEPAVAAAGGWTSGRLSAANHSGSGGAVRNLRSGGGSDAGSPHNGVATTAPAAAGESTILQQSGGQSPPPQPTIARMASVTSGAGATPTTTTGPNTRLRRKYASDAAGSSTTESAAVGFHPAAATHLRHHSNSAFISTTTPSVAVLVHRDSMHGTHTDNTAAAATASDGTPQPAMADSQLLPFPSPSLSPSSSPVGTGAGQAAVVAASGCSSPSAGSGSPLPPFQPRSSPRGSPTVQLTSKRLTLPAHALVNSVEMAPVAAPPASASAVVPTSCLSSRAASLSYLGAEGDAGEMLVFEEQPLHQVSEGNEPNASSAGSHYE